MSTVGRTSPAQGEVRCERRADNTLLLRLVGDWRIDAAAPVVTEVAQFLAVCRRSGDVPNKLTCW
jgi:hypothetical protein